GVCGDGVVGLVGRRWWFNGDFMVAMFVRNGWQTMIFCCFGKSNLLCMSIRLIYESGLKQRLFKYAASALLFTRKGVDPLLCIMEPDTMCALPSDETPVGKKRSKKDTVMIRAKNV
nr:pachytene checkpoint protein 2 homolog [Tanacetum cinerariifolium]